MSKLSRLLVAVAATLLLLTAGESSAAESGWYCSPVIGEQGHLLGICCATTIEQFRLECPQPQAT